MNGRKNRPLLYEVVQRGAQSAQAATPQPVRKPDIAAPAHPAEVKQAVRPDLSRPTPIETPPSAVGGRRFSLSGPAIAIIVVAVVMLLFLTFEAGRKYEAHQANSMSSDGALSPAERVGAQGSSAGSGKDESNGENEVPFASTANDGESEADGDQPEQQTSPPAPRVVLQPGTHYVVVQYFPKSKKQNAIDAAEYLKTNGVPCALLHGADIQLVATEPFLIDQPNAAAGRQARERGNQLVRRIRELGKDYGPKGGYDFGGCKLRKFK